MNRLEQRGILPKPEVDCLREAYRFYRKLEIILEAEFEFKEGYLDPRHERMEELAARLSFPGSEALFRYFSELRNQVRAIYLKTLKVQDG